jgi:hypothetical protein
MADEEADDWSDMIKFGPQQPEFDEQGDPIEPDEPESTAPTSRKNVAPRCTAEQLEERIEFVRSLIRLNFGVGDVKRMASKRFGVKRKTVQAYLSYARERNRSILDATEDQALADSLLYWSRKQQDCEATIQREKLLQAKSIEVLRSAEKEIDELETGRTPDNPQTERLEILEMRKRTAVKLIDHARRACFTSEQGSRDAQDRIDRLRGNLAPIKLARTTKAGDDIDDPTKREPATVADANREIVELLGRIRSKGASESQN